MPQTARKLDYFKEFDQHVEDLRKRPKKKGNISTYDLDRERKLKAQPKNAHPQVKSTRKEKVEEKVLIEKKPKSFRSVLSCFFVIFAICGIFSLIILRYMIISNNNTTINSLKSDIAEIEAQIQYNEVQAELKSDLEEIKKVASEELHMGFPTSDQIVYINLNQNIDDTEDTKLADSGVN
ncbi:MAG: hypothetical protein R2876_01455 [Eubacteriales bacterium]